jgi:hypothetical protein
MAKTKYTDASPAMEDLVSKLMETWPDRFLHITR